MRAAFEHHMNFDRTGYPEIAREWGQATLSRIVAVADCFDAMTAHRAYRRRPFTQFEALRRLIGPDRDQFDPSVRWALIRTVGVYPPGTLLQTVSGHVVLSMSPNPTDPRRPHCKILTRPDGTSPPREAPEYWEPFPEEMKVKQVLKPEVVGIDVDEHFRTFV
jgi:hypothetical protein